MRLLAIALAAVLLLAPRLAVAAERVSPCTPARAEHLTVRAIAADPTRFVGRCVTITAVKIKSALYDDVEGVYAGLGRTGWDPSENHAAFGIDPGRHRAPDFARMTVTGRVGDCDCVHAYVREQAEQGQIVMALGYCHYFVGPYLQANRVETLGPARLERRLPGSGHGDLAPVAADWPGRAKAETVADRFVSALRAGDSAALMALDMPDYDPKEWDASWGAELRRTVRFLQRSPAFAELRTGQALPQRVVLAEPEASEADPVTVCFCRLADCTGRWPIAAIDADNLPSRPYACIGVEDYVVFRKGPVPSVSIPMATAGLAEPRR